MRLFRLCCAAQLATAQSGTAKISAEALSRTVNEHPKEVHENEIGDHNHEPRATDGLERSGVGWWLGLGVRFQD